MVRDEALSSFMISMHGVSSSLIARNESWVRQQASALARRLPSNVEKADLIQAGLIAVAQAALGFEWEGDPDSEEAKEAFVRYARMRVKGAMLDELRQMDHLGRAQRRKVKVIQIARERLQASTGVRPSLAELSAACGIEMEEIVKLDQAAQALQTQNFDEEPNAQGIQMQHPATSKDEVEARVDTGILMRRLEKFFAALPDRERQVIDSYLGVGMTPVELADSLKVSPSRISQLYKAVFKRIARHFEHPDQRALDRLGPESTLRFEEMIALREAELAREANGAPWEELVEDALDVSNKRFGASSGAARMRVDGNTRW
jgi:RNA polymerase sigma factor FliA